MELLISSNPFSSTVGLRYSWGLHPKNISQIPKLWITRDHRLGLFGPFFDLIKTKICKGNVREYQVLYIMHKPRIVKTTNNKLADNEGRMYTQRQGAWSVFLIFKIWKNLAKLSMLKKINKNSSFVIWILLVVVNNS